MEKIEKGRTICVGGDIGYCYLQIKNDIVGVGCYNISTVNLIYCRTKIESDKDYDTTKIDQYIIEEVDGYFEKYINP